MSAPNRFCLRAPSIAQWESGLTTLEGQGFLPLEDAPDVDEMFEMAELCEADGLVEEAARLYSLFTSADRSDPIAPYNLGNIFFSQGNNDEVVLAIKSHSRAIRPSSRPTTISRWHYFVGSSEISAP